VNITATAVDFLFFTQSAESNIKVLTVEHYVGFADAVGQNLLPQSPYSHLYLNQSIVLAKSVAVSAGNIISLSQDNLPRSSDHSVNQYVLMSQDASLLSNWPLITSNLELDQSVVGDLAKAAYDTLELTQEVIVSPTLNITVVQTLHLLSQVTGYLPSRYWTAYDINVVEP
jgi:hypothetical protein